MRALHYHAEVDALSSRRVCYKSKPTFSMAEVEKQERAHMIHQSPLDTPGPSVLDFPAFKMINKQINLLFIYYSVSSILL